PDRERLATVFKTLGFRSLTAEFADQAPRTVEAVAGAPAEGAADYKAIMTLPDLEGAVAAARAAGRIAVDTETDSTARRRAKRVGFSMSWAPRQGVYVPVGHASLGAPDQLDPDDIRERLAPVLGDPAVKKVGQNLKYDTHVLRRHGLPIEGW